MENQNLHDFLVQNGGVKKIADALDITARAVYKWSQNNALPRTEYTDETSYSQTLSEISGVPANEIKAMFRPSK